MDRPVPKDKLVLLYLAKQGLLSSQARVRLYRARVNNTFLKQEHLDSSNRRIKVYLVTNKFPIKINPNNLLILLTHQVLDLTSLPCLVKTAMLLLG